MNFKSIGVAVREICQPHTDHFLKNTYSDSNGAKKVVQRRSNV